MKAETLMAAGALIVILTRERNKIPTGACIQPDGRKRYPRPPCDKNGRGPYIGPGRDGKPLYQPCDKPGDCAPEMLVDPLTGLVHTVGVAMLTIGTASHFMKRGDW